ALAGSTAPDVARPCSFSTRLSLSRSTTENFDESSLFSENSVSIWLRAAGPMSLKNHQCVSAWFSNSQIAILIFACANPDTGSARPRASAAPVHCTVFFIILLNRDPRLRTLDYRLSTPDSRLPTTDSNSARQAPSRCRAPCSPAPIGPAARQPAEDLLP